MEQVVLVNESDKEIGTMEKIEAHQKGALHRAFSLLIFNSKGEVLLQKRAKSKYHSGGLWTNACCSHPHPGEPMEQAIHRKLMQEMGIEVQPEFAFKFLYKSNLDHQLIEHEIDHVFTGVFDGKPSLNKNEAEDWKFISLEELRSDIKMNPGNYTYWFRLIIAHPSLERSLI